jgi:hypothetical protein
MILIGNGQTRMIADLTKPSRAREPQPARALVFRSDPSAPAHTLAVLHLQAKPSNRRFLGGTCSFPL